MTGGRSSASHTAFTARLTQWWHDVVTDSLTARRGSEATGLWLGDSFEFAEVHVHPGHQARGTGRAMMHALAAGRPSGPPCCPRRTARPGPAPLPQPRLRRPAGRVQLPRRRPASRDHGGDAAAAGSAAGRLAAPARAGGRCRASRGSRSACRSEGPGPPRRAAARTCCTRISTPTSRTAALLSATAGQPVRQPRRQPRPRQQHHPLQRPHAGDRHDPGDDRHRTPPAAATRSRSRR